MKEKEIKNDVKEIKKDLAKKVVEIDKLFSRGIILIAIFFVLIIILVIFLILTL